MCFKKNVQASDAGEEFESKLELSKKLENQSGKKKLKQKNGKKCRVQASDAGEEVESKLEVMAVAGSSPVTVGR